MKNQTVLIAALLLQGCVSTHVAYTSPGHSTLTVDSTRFGIDLQGIHGQMTADGITFDEVKSNPNADLINAAVSAATGAAAKALKP